MTKTDSFNEVRELVFKGQLTQDGLEELRKKYPADLVVDMTNEQAFKDARKTRTERNKLTEAINKRRLGVSNDLKEYAGGLMTEVEEIYAVIVGPFEEEDAKRKKKAEEEKLKLEKLLAEQRSQIESIKQYEAEALKSTSDQISGMIDAIGNINPSSFHKDLVHEVIDVIDDVKAKLSDMLIKQVETERLKEESDKSEKLRIATERVNALRMIPMDLLGKDSTAIAKKINSVACAEINEEEFGQLTQEAEQARTTVLNQLDAMLKQAEQVESFMTSTASSTATSESYQDDISQVQQSAETEYQAPACEASGNPLAGIPVTTGAAMKAAAQGRDQVTLFDALTQFCHERGLNESTCNQLIVLVGGYTSLDQAA
jgi:hypothetical protein